MPFRVESDFLGNVQIPQDAYYGVQTARAMDNFPITGYKTHPAMIKAMALVKKAAALSNKTIGMLDSTIAYAIVEACDEVISGKLSGEFTTDPIQGGAGTSMNMNANEVIANRALELVGKAKGDYSYISPNDHVNMAQSTNDVIPTSIHLACLDLLEGLLLELSDLVKAFGVKQDEFKAIIKMGRTHLQDAVPILLGQEFEAYRLALQRDYDRINRCKDNLYPINMGATAVGTGLNASPEYIKEVVKLLKELTGYPLTSCESLVDGTQNTDVYVELSSMLKVCMMTMSKICNDIRMMASGPKAGLYELVLPSRQPGSSIMPGKVNPVMAEVVNQVAFQVAGNDLTVAMACEAGQFELNVMEPVIVHNLLQSLSIMTNVFKVFRNYLLEGLQANTERLHSYVDNSIGIITAINPHVGYKTASKIAKEALQTGKSIREIILRDKILTAEELDSILDPFEMTSPGISGSALLKKKQN